MTPLLREKLAHMRRLTFKCATRKPMSIISGPRSIRAKHSYHTGPAHHAIPQQEGLKLSFPRGWGT